MRAALERGQAAYGRVASLLGLITLSLRVLLESTIIAAFAYWGSQSGSSITMRVLLAVGAPIIAFGFWGAVDFHQAGRYAEPLRLAQELLVSGVAATSLAVTGHSELAIAMVALALAYHGLVYAQGGRLLTKIKTTNHGTQ